MRRQGIHIQIAKQSILSIVYLSDLRIFLLKLLDV